ncbi:MAG: hypothetical protein GY851_31225 [bacterium]|nr:hypothetical protein [bacterium]
MAVPKDVIIADAASVLYIDDAGKRYRLPQGDAAIDSPGLLGPERIAREVCTERDLFNCRGTFYELPAQNAGGFARIRPIATHNRRITDYCSWRGLLVLSGVADDTCADNPHIVRAEDGQCALWVGEVDDLWRLGKPVGQGGPWKDTRVGAGVPSEPYLMTGYDNKHLELSHNAAEAVRFTLEVDFSGTGWHTYETFDVPPGETRQHDFPKGFTAYWVRVVLDRACTATAWLMYE